MRRLSGTEFAERKVLSQYYILWQKGEPSRAKFLRGLEKTGRKLDEKTLCIIDSRQKFLVVSIKYESWSFDTKRGRNFMSVKAQKFLYNFYTMHNRNESNYRVFHVK